MFTCSRWSIPASTHQPAQTGPCTRATCKPQPIRQRWRCSREQTEEPLPTSLPGRVWIVLQFVLTLLLILVGLAWTRLPDKHGWQVMLSLLIPFLLIVSALELQPAPSASWPTTTAAREAGFGAITLLVWIAIGAAAWWLLDWCDDQIPEWPAT